MSYIRECIIGFKKRGLHIGILWVWLFIEGKIVPYPSLSLIIPRSLAFLIGQVSVLLIKIWNSRGGTDLGDK